MTTHSPSAEEMRKQTCRFFWDAETLALRMENTTRSVRIDRCREALEERESYIRSLEKDHAAMRVTLEYMKEKIELPNTNWLTVVNEYERRAKETLYSLLIK